MIYLNGSWKDTNLEKFIKKLNIDYEFCDEYKNRFYYTFYRKSVYAPRKVSSLNNNVIDIYKAENDEYSYKTCAKKDFSNNIDVNFVSNLNELLSTCKLIEIHNNNSNEIKINKFIKPDSDSIYYLNMNLYTLFIFFNKYYCDELFCVYIDKHKSIDYRQSMLSMSNNKIIFKKITVHGDYLHFDFDNKKFDIVPENISEEQDFIDEYGDVKHNTYRAYDCLSQRCITYSRVVFNGCWFNYNGTNIEVIDANNIYLFLNFDFDGSAYYTSENKTLVNTDDSHFFQNIGKFLKAYNIKNLKDIDDGLFWEICNKLYIDAHISKMSGVARCLKYKIIIINKLLGFDNINNKQFKLNSLHYNAVKKDYYFTRDLSLDQVLQFKFITQKEKDYINKYLLDKNVAKKSKKEDKEYKQYVEDVLKNKDNKYNYSSLKELLRLLPNETEKNIRKKFFEVNRNILKSYRRNAWDKLNRTQRKVICVENNNIYDDCYIAEKQLKIRNIGNCCDGYQQTAGGYHWKYVEEENEND